MAGAEAGRRRGKPICIRSVEEVVPLVPVVEPGIREEETAGGGTSSNRRSLKCDSCIATPNVPGCERRG